MLDWFTSMNVIVRGHNAGALTQATRAAVAAIDRNVPVFGVRTLHDDVAVLVAAPRFVASVLTAFASVALLIAAIGVYGVMSYSTGQRTREVGIRTALGATRARVLATMLREGVAMIAAGLGVGTLAALGVSQLLAGTVHEATRVDAGAVIAVALLLAGAALLAAYIPTRRATRVDPLVALRHE